MTTQTEQRIEKLKTFLAMRVIATGEDWLQFDNGEKVYLSKKYIII